MGKLDIEFCENIADEMIENVKKAISPYIGKKEGGEIVKLGADGSFTHKIDIAAEDEVIKCLEKSGRTCYLISEELGEVRISNGKSEEIDFTKYVSENYPFPDDELIFIIDPLDGTSNAVKNIPFYSISIAVAKFPKNGKHPSLKDIEIGFVKNLASGDLYSAIKGKGAYLNGEIITSSNKTDFKSVSFGGFLGKGFEGIKNILKNVRRMRLLGSVALELAFVASRNYDIFIDLRKSRVMDVPAAKLIVEESGGIVTSLEGEELDTPLSIKEKTYIIASGNNTLQEKILNNMELSDNIKNPIKKIGIAGRVDTEESVRLAFKIVEYLNNRNIEFIIEDSLFNAFRKIEDVITHSNIVFHFEKIEDFDVDILIALGGDGTILRCQNKLTDETPLFGINMGTVGFLAEVNRDKTFPSIEKILNKEYTIEKRSQIKVIHNYDLFSALNEVVIMTGKPSKMLHFEISVDGSVIETIRADGLIISTPSGSTAYSMSAGGPIVDPKVEAFIIIPICPFKLGTRAVVVPDSSEIKVRLLKKGKKAFVVIDGQIDEEIDELDEMIFTKYEKNAYFVKLNKEGFYEKVREKLTDGGAD
ncbi:MAG: bifunctional NADP phosphatase/NAD kinase [Methanobacteriaceae archaeon]